MLQKQINNYLTEVRYYNCKINDFGLVPNYEMKTDSQFVCLRFCDGYNDSLKLKVGDFNIDYDLYLKLKSNLSQVVTKPNSDSLGKVTAIVVCNKLFAIGKDDSFLLISDMFGKILSKTELYVMIQKVMKENFEKIIQNFQNDANLLINNLTSLLSIASNYKKIDLSISDISRVYESLNNVISKSQLLSKETH